MATQKGSPAKRAQNPKDKPGKAPRKASGGMDSDTKTISKILFGLVGMLVLLGGMVYAYDLLNKKPPVATVDIAAPTVRADDTEQLNASLKRNGLHSVLAATKGVVGEVSRGVGDGPRSTFDPTRAYEPGEVILSNPPRGFEDRIRSKGFSVKEHLRLPSLGLSLARVATPLKMSVQDAIRVLAQLLPGVTVDANTYYEASAVASYDRTNANPRALAGWSDLSPTCGKGLVLGQIDSGVDLGHEALKGSDITYRTFPGAGRQPGPADHGTAVAAMLVGNASWGGLLPGAKLYAANMFEVNEEGKKVGSATGLLRGLDWLVSQHVHAINLSIAGSDNKVVREAFAMAKRRNQVLVAAVGNWGRADKPAYPAAYQDVVAVTATKGAELVYSHANSGEYVDFAAPGVGVYTALPGGGGKLQSGTSFAAPFITVTAAVLAHAGKVPDAEALRRMLSPVTRDLGRPGKDTVFGFGALKARPLCR